MFKTLGKLVSGTVVVAGEVVRVSAKAGITLTGNAVASASEAFVGKNAFSDGVREVKDGLNKVTDKVVDVGAPIAGRIASAPLRKAEHTKDLVVGGVHIVVGNREKGWAKVKTAGKALAWTALTWGVLDDDNREIISGVLDAIGDSAGDVVETVADAFDSMGDSVGNGVHAVLGVDAGADTLADPGDALLSAGTDSAEHVGNALASAAAPDPHALASAAAPVHESVVSHVSHAVRFQGLTHAEALQGMADEETRIAFVQHLIDNLSPDAPRHVLDRLQLLQAGAWKTADQVLTDAESYVNVSTQAAGVFFG